MPYMQKSRILATAFGDSNGRYLSSTAGIYIPSETFTYLQENTHKEYAMGHARADSFVSPQNGFGAESFQSTSRKRPWFNACYHERKQGYNFPYLICIQGSPISMGFWQPYMRMAASGSFGMVPLHLGATWADVDGCQRRAWWSMQPRFESEFSFLNFVYEMKDFDRLFKSLFEWRSTIDKLKNFSSKIVRHIRGGKSPLNSETTLFGISNVPASAWLTYQFAIAPLISDVVELMKIFNDTVHGAQDEFRARGLTRQRSHYSEVLADNFVGTYGDGTSSWIYTGTRQSAKFTATLEYTYQYAMRGFAEMHAKYLGMNITPEVIWNALPLSFLLDYFYKVGKALHWASLDPNVKLNVLQYSESILEYAFYGRAADTENQVVQLFYAPAVTPSFYFGSVHDRIVPLVGFMSQIYERKIGAPNRGAALPQFSMPGKTQKWNIAALIRSFMK